jgi:chorismate mutase/prephenate dehydrogenase
MTADDARQQRLTKIRKEIDGIDDQLLTLLERRARVVAEAWQLKEGLGLSIHDPRREREILDRLRMDARELDPELVEHIFRRIVGVATPPPEAVAGDGCRSDDSGPSSAAPESDLF